MLPSETGRGCGEGTDQVIGGRRRPDPAPVTHRPGSHRFLPPCPPGGRISHGADRLNVIVAFRERIRGVWSLLALLIRPTTFRAGRLNMAISQQ
jgi:hypothetical protein